MLVEQFSTTLTSDVTYHQEGIPPTLRELHFVDYPFDHKIFAKVNPELKKEIDPSIAVESNFKLKSVGKLINYVLTTISRIWSYVSSLQSSLQKL